jgi:hypothetical protein
MIQRDTIIAWVLLVLIVAILAFMFWPPPHRDPPEPSVRATLAALAKGVEMFHADQGRLPTEAEGLRPLRPEYIETIPVDAWGHPYRYRLLQKAAEVASAGGDGVFDTDDDMIHETRVTEHEPRG